MKISKYQRAVVAGLAGMAAVATLASNPASGLVVSQSARGVALQVDLPLLAPVSLADVSATGTQGPVSEQVLGADAGIASASVLKATAQTRGAQPKPAPGAFARASASVAGLDFGIPLSLALGLPPLLGGGAGGGAEGSAEVITSRCDLSAHRLELESKILDADVRATLALFINAISGGATVDQSALVAVPPNTTFPLPLGGSIILNEQIIVISPNHDAAEATVNAIHLDLPGPQGDVIVSSSNCKITGGGPNSIDVSTITTGPSGTTTSGSAGAGAVLPSVPAGSSIGLEVTNGAAFPGVPVLGGPGTVSGTVGTSGSIVTPFLNVGIGSFISALGLF